MQLKTQQKLEFSKKLKLKLKPLTLSFQLPVLCVDCDFIEVRLQETSFHGTKAKFVFNLSRSVQWLETQMSSLSSVINPILALHNSSLSFVTSVHILSSHSIESSLSR